MQEHAECIHAKIIEGIASWVELPAGIPGADGFSTASFCTRPALLHRAAGWRIITQYPIFYSLRIIAASEVKDKSYEAIARRLGQSITR